MIAGVGNGRYIYYWKSKGLPDERINFIKTSDYGNISKDWSVDNIKKTGLNGYVFDFSSDYDAIAVDYILGIHK